MQRRPRPTVGPGAAASSSRSRARSRRSSRRVRRSRARAARPTRPAKAGCPRDARRGVTTPRPPDRLEQIGQLRIPRDALVNFTATANEPRLGSCGAHPCDARDLPQVVAAHVVQHECPCFDVFDRIEVREHAPQRVADQRLAPGSRWRTGVEKEVRVESAEDATLDLSAADVLVDHVRSDGARPRVERAVAAVGSDREDDLDHRLLREVAAVRIARAQEAAHRAVDLGTQSVVQGSGRARVAARERREQLAVIECGDRGRRMRRGGAGRRAGDEPQLGPEVGALGRHPRGHSTATPPGPGKD